MVISRINRRQMLAALAAGVALPQMAKADAIDLTWTDLLPEGEVQTAVPTFLQGLIDHDGPPLVNAQPASSGVRADWNGSLIRLPGFIVPIDYKGSGVVAFILVPFVGACVHVPPPPANQLVFVTTDEPFESAGLYEAVTVTGVLGISTIATELAVVGYALSANKIEPFSA